MCRCRGFHKNGQVPLKVCKWMSKESQDGICEVNNIKVCDVKDCVAHTGKPKVGKFSAHLKNKHMQLLKITVS